MNIENRQLGFGSQIPNLPSDTSSENYLYADDPHRVANDRFREQFGRDTQFVFRIDPPKIFAPTVSGHLREFHEAIESDPPDCPLPSS